MWSFRHGLVRKTINPRAPLSISQASSRLHGVLPELLQLLRLVMHDAARQGHRELSANEDHHLCVDGAHSHHPGCIMFLRSAQNPLSVLQPREGFGITSVQKCILCVAGEGYIRVVVTANFITARRALSPEFQTFHNL